LENITSVETISKGQHLIIHKLPEIFQQRYGKVPKQIFVRECYISLYKTVSDKMVKGDMEYGVMLFTGVPGIGKSMFLIYFIYRFLHDNQFKDKRFALEFQQGLYFSFKPTPDDATVFLCTSKRAELIQPKNFLLLCDIHDTLPPFSRAKWTFIFSSPTPARYREMLKHFPSCKYIMPTWSEQELMFVEADISKWYDNFVLFGGVPRHVLHGSASHNMLKEALAAKGGAIAENFFKFSFGAVDSLQNYMLVHINPPLVAVAGDGDGEDNFDYKGETVYSFASDFIFQWLVSKNNAQMLAGAVGMFNAGAASEAYGAVSAGNLFEKICLWLKPLNGQHISAASLDQSFAKPLSIVVPEDRHVLAHNWKKTAQLPVNMLILPHICNLESGDAFFVAPCGSDRFLLVVFQITVATSHPVKINGLHDILLAFPENVRSKITQKFLVFVVPTHCPLDKAQTLYTQKNAHAKLVPNIVKGFKQYVYRHII